MLRQSRRLSNIAGLVILYVSSRTLIYIRLLYTKSIKRVIEVITYSMYVVQELELK